LGNYDITNEIDIYNTTHTGSEQIVSDYNALYKLYPDPKNSYHSKAKSCFTISKAHRQKIAIGKHEFFIGPIEVCTLESLYYTDVSTSTYQAELIKRVIKKHKTTRDWDIIKQVI
jgi:hypothetical protein